MTFVDGVAYGIRYEMGATSVEVVGMDPATGNQVMSVKESGYQSPIASVERSWSGNGVVVRIQNGNRFELWQVDVKSKKRVQRLTLEGYGQLGEYGETSAAWQGPYLALWAHVKHAFTTGTAEK